jgi:hypothetical protein
MGFREDESQIRIDHVPANMAVLRYIAFSLVRGDKTRKVGVKASLRKVRRSTDYMGATGGLGFAIALYYHRFEIEETFRDIKTILGLRRTKLTKPNSLAILLWFVNLGIIILFLAGIGTMGIRALMQLLAQPHPKKKLSWYRILLELREAEIRDLSYDELYWGG